MRNISKHTNLEALRTLLGELEVLKPDRIKNSLTSIYRDIVLDTLESCKFKTTEQLDFLLDQESEPNTVHEGLFRSYKEQFLAYYKDVFTPSYALNKLSKVLELGKEQLLQTALGPALEAAGLLEVEVDDLKRLLPLSEPNQNAIEIMASTSAHSQSKQFIYLLLCIHYMKLNIEQLPIDGFQTTFRLRSTSILFEVLADNLEMRFMKGSIFLTKRRRLISKSFYENLTPLWRTERNFWRRRIASRLHGWSLCKLCD